MWRVMGGLVMFLILESVFKLSRKPEIAASEMKSLTVSHSTTGQG